MRRPMIHTRKIAALATAILMISLLAACSLPLPGAKTPPPGETPTSQPGGEPTPTGPTASFGGVSFSLDPAIAAAATGAVLPDTSDPSMPPDYDKGPARVAFTFDGYTGPTTTIPAIVYVYTLADLAGRPEEAMASGLATLLQERPDLAGQEQLPFLPFLNAAQALHTRDAYRDFAYGAGIETIALYAQGPSPITADRLWYTFQGLTSDGMSYVAAAFPLSTDLFPAEIPPDFNYDEWFAGYDQYMADSRKALADAPADRFVPALDKLDALVQSIAVTPGQATQAAPTTPIEPVSANFAGTYAATLPAADTPGRAMTLVLNQDGTASMSTDYLNGQPAIVETGAWQDNGDGTVTVNLTQVGENVLATPDVITFAQQDGLLVAVDYDREAYGLEGITLQKAGEAGTVAPAPVAANEPITESGPAEPGTSTELTGITWQLQQIGRQGGVAIPVADPAKYTVTLNADGSAMVVADCNTGAGSYQVDGGAISFELATTRMACPPPSLSSQFVKYLEYADSYIIENGSLLLSYGNGSTTMTFAPAGQ